MQIFHLNLINYYAAIIIF